MFLFECKQNKFLVVFSQQLQIVCSVTIFSIRVKVFLLKLGLNRAEMGFLLNGDKAIRRKKCWDRRRKFDTKRHSARRREFIVGHSSHSFSVRPIIVLRESEWPRKKKQRRFGLAQLCLQRAAKYRTRPSAPTMRPSRHHYFISTSINRSLNRHSSAPAADSLGPTHLQA